MSDQSIMTIPNYPSKSIPNSLFDIFTYTPILSTKLELDHLNGNNITVILCWHTCCLRLF